MADYNLQEEITLWAEDEHYQIQYEVNVPDMDEGSVSSALERAIDATVSSPDAILDQEIFDIFRSLIKYSTSLSQKTHSKLLDLIVSSLQAEIDASTRDLESDDPTAYLSHKAPLEMYAFLLQWYITAAEKTKPSAGDEELGANGKLKKGKGKGTAAAKKKENWSWESQIPSTLSLMAKALRLKTDRIWTTTQEREAFINCFTRPAYQIAEKESYMKSAEIKLGVYKIICLSVKFHGHAFGAQTSIIQNLQYYEHLSEPMAELLSILANEFDYSHLTEEVLREISTKSFGGQDTKGPRSFSKFLIKLAEVSPRVVHKQFSLLLPHLDSEAYPIRMAIVEIIGILIKEVTISEDMDEEIKKKQIVSYFELLTNRFLDMNSWVRAKVITTIVKLLEVSKFLKQRPLITTLAIRHLEDKSASVRRQAIALVTKLITSHPFGQLHGGLLNLPEWQERFDSLCAELEKLEPKELEKPAQEKEDGEEDKEQEQEEEDDEAENADGEVNEDDSENGDGLPTPRKKATSKKVPKKSRKSDVLDVKAIAQEQEAALANAEIVQKLQLTKKYYSDALVFVKAIEGAIPKLSELLISTGRAEVLEAMDFFKTAYEYNLEGSSVGIKAMLHLVWTKDNNAVVEGDDGKELKGIRSRVIECYKQLYFEAIADLSAKEQVNRIAKNMIERTYNATLAELTSLEELMRTMMSEGSVHPDVINKLWQVYNVDKPIPRVQRRGAIIILGMLAVAKKEIVVERIDSLLNIGLGPLGKADLVLARYTCVALQRISGSVKKIKGSLVDKSNRLPMDNAIFHRLKEAIEHPASSTQWFGVAEQAINTIYLLGEQPDAMCGEIIKNLTRRVFLSIPASADFSGSGDETVIAENDDDQAPPPTPATQARMPRSGSQGSLDGSDNLIDTFQLAQLVFVVGHIAIKHIVYLELVEREFKRRKEGEAKEKAAKKAADKDGNDLDQVTGNAEDDIGDIIADIRERELLYGENSLLAIYGPLIAEICSKPNYYKDSTLRIAAVLSLTKLMCVSSQFCEGHLPLLFKVLETTQDPGIRSNIVIGLGDVAVCFSNMIDENSDQLYKGLADSDGHVKKNTLMVLTHLILNGMIKVKGQLGEMAKCLEDEDKRIGDLAKLFFMELSTKDNALYNNLQDVISHLSLGENAVDEEAFQRTMKYIFTFIEKEKQAESIIEKLCQRFRLATEERQWRDIAFCLSLLPYKSERSVKKLIDGLQFYQDKLYEETVFKRFSEILAKSRTNKLPNKPESELKEFEDILEAHKNKGVEEQELDAQVSKKVKASKRRRAAKEAAPAPSRRSRRQQAEEEEEEEEETEAEVEQETEAEKIVEEEEESPKPMKSKRQSKSNKKPAPAPRKGRRKAVIESDEEDVEDEEE